MPAGLAKDSCKPLQLEWQLVSLEYKACLIRPELIVKGDGVNTIDGLSSIIVTRAGYSAVQDRRPAEPETKCRGRGEISLLHLSKAWM